VETGGIRVTGFPNRFDTMVDGPALSFPASGTTLSAPFLQVFALSYRPNQIVVAFPETARLTGPLGDADIAADNARASATFDPGLDLALDHANVVIEGLSIESAGRTLSAGRLLAASRIPADAESGRVQNIGVTLDEIRLPDTLAEQLGGATLIDGARLDATVTLAEPITRANWSGEPVEVQSIRIDTLEIDWGDVGVDASGTLDVGADGYLLGELTAAVENWPRALEIAAGAGLLPPDQVSTVQRGLSLLAGLSGSASRIELPLTFREGQAWLGPVPVGEAPRF
jgi:hypothetical protein